jgi:hypothetical protein
MHPKASLLRQLRKDRLMPLKTKYFVALFLLNLSAVALANRTIYTSLMPNSNNWQVSGGHWVECSLSNPSTVTLSGTMTFSMINAAGGALPPQNPTTQSAVTGNWQMQPVSTQTSTNDFTLATGQSASVWFTLNHSWAAGLPLTAAVAASSWNPAYVSVTVNGLTGFLLGACTVWWNGGLDGWVPSANHGAGDYLGGSGFNLIPINGGKPF